MRKYIDADELKKVFRYTEDAEYARWTLAGIIGEIDDIEAADVEEVRHGRWIFSPDHAEGICTSCHYKIYGRPYQNTYMIVPYNYCPNCGAKIDLVETE